MSVLFHQKQSEETFIIKIIGFKLMRLMYNFLILRNKRILIEKKSLKKHVTHLMLPTALP